MREFDPEYALGQFVNPSIRVSPMFLGQNRGPETMGPEYFGLDRSGEIDRFFGCLGQSSVDDGHVMTSDFLGLSAVSLETIKVTAARKASLNLTNVRATLREAGRADLVTDLNTVATMFQSKIESASSREAVGQWVQWLERKMSVLLEQSSSGAATSSETNPRRRRTSGRGAPPPPPEDPIVEETGGSTNFLVLGGIALAIVGVYLLMQDAG